jgi:hypothetical protein
MLSPRSGHHAVLLASGRVLIAGGVDNRTASSFSTTEIYDPAKDVWTPGPSMLAHLGDDESTLTLLSDGRAVLAGGTAAGAGNVVATVEIFKPGDDPNGSPCSSDGECATNHCSDGVCCDTACNTTCVACSASTKASGSDGACGPAKPATDPHATCTDDGSPACSNNGLCDGAGACAGYPLSTACSALACTKAADCTSGFCVDGICCDKTCAGTCEACTAAKKGSGIDGVCGNVAAGTDPRDRCTVDPGFPGNCHADGLCDGAGACRTFAPSATICGTPTCAAGVQKTPACDGAGVCNLGSTSCAPFACDAAGAICAKTCTVDPDCGTGAYCDTGTCKPKKANGEAASTTSQCQGGIVADGVCCNDACTGLCEACDAGTTKGTCTAVVGSARHGSCPGPTAGNLCSGGVCDGKSRTSCAGLPGPSTICQAASCSGGIEIQQGLCDGGGTCPVPVTHKCDPYVCGAKACLSKCSSGDDCVAGSRCDAATSTCVASGSCSADLTTSTSPTKEVTKCYPVLCIPSKGSCGDTCQSAADCASPFVCDTQHNCVNPPSLTSGSGGCASSGRGSGSGLALGCVAAVAALLRCRRRAA